MKLWKRKRENTENAQRTVQVGVCPESTHELQAQTDSSVDSANKGLKIWHS